MFYMMKNILIIKDWRKTVKKIEQKNVNKSIKKYKFALFTEQVVNRKLQFFSVKITLIKNMFKLLCFNGHLPNWMQFSSSANATRENTEAAALMYSNKPSRYLLV